MILPHTSTIFCGMPITFFCNIQNSFCHAFSLLCHGYNLFCYSNYSVLWISCLWFLLQPLPNIISKLSSHPYNFLCHSNDIVSHVHKTFCDPHKIFCYPYYYANELPVFYNVLSILLLSQWTMIDIRIHFDYFKTHCHLGLSGAIG